MTVGARGENGGGSVDYFVPAICLLSSATYSRTDVDLVDSSSTSYTFVHAEHATLFPAERPQNNVSPAYNMYTLDRRARRPMTSTGIEVQRATIHTYVDRYASREEKGSCLSLCVCVCERVPNDLSILGLGPRLDWHSYNVVMFVPVCVCASALSMINRFWV